MKMSAVRLRCAECQHTVSALSDTRLVGPMAEHCHAVKHTWRPADRDVVRARDLNGTFWIGPPSAFAHDMWVTTKPVN